jgi:hypothetical protein
VTTADRRALRSQLVTQFSLEELRTLCFDMGINADSVATADANILARELIALCERTERCEELQAEIAKARPATKPATPAKKATPPRKRGGQPNNGNAVKHGLYAKNYTPIELAELPAAMAANLDEEIAMMRICMARVFDATQQEDVNLEQLQDLLGSLGVAATRLSGLLKTQKLLSGDHAAIASAITEALAAVVKEFCLA